MMKETLGSITDIPSDFHVALQSGRVLIAQNTQAGYGGQGGFFVLLDAQSLPALGRASK